MKSHTLDEVIFGCLGAAKNIIEGEIIMADVSSLKDAFNAKDKDGLKKAGVTIMPLRDDISWQFINRLKNYYNNQDDEQEKKAYLKFFKGYISSYLERDFDSDYKERQRTAKFQNRFKRGLLGASLAGAIASAAIPEFWGFFQAFSIAPLLEFFRYDFRNCNPLNKELKKAKQYYDKCAETKRNIDSMSLTEIELVLDLKQEQIKDFIYSIK